MKTEQILDIQDQIELLAAQVGNTPIFDFSNLLETRNSQLWGKLEWRQLSGSVKARAAFGIIKSAVDTGKLDGEKILLDASSGNTAIAYASIARELELPFTAVIPENASQKRKDLLVELGAEIIFSSPFEGTDGAQQVAKELNEQFPEKYFYADQYNNDHNWLQHYNTTGPEIWEQTKGAITHFAASLGTTGTFTGVGRYLKSKNGEVCLVQMQPDSPMHGLEGWKHLETAKVPGIHDYRLADQSIEVNSIDALRMIKTVREKFNLSISPSAAASLVGAKQIAEQNANSFVLTTLADDGTKYREVYDDLGLTHVDELDQMHQKDKK